MLAQTNPYVMPSAFRDDDSVTEANTNEGPGGLFAASRMVFGHDGRRSLLKKFGLAMLVLATAGTACVLVRRSLPAHNVAPGNAGALTVFGEKKSKKKDKEKKKDKCGGPFDKCGGNNFIGKSCCKRGCACVKDSQYFSMCKAPAGLDECDVTKATKMADRLRDKATPLRKKSEKKKKMYKEKQAFAEKEEAAFVKARDLAMKALQKAQAEKAEMDKQNATLQEHIKKMHAVGWQKDQALMYWKTAKNEKNRDCGTWNGDCTASKCCQHGCGCISKNAFYSQCGPPKGQSTCSVDIANAAAKRHAIQATGDKKKSSAEDAEKACDHWVGKVKKEQEDLKKLVELHVASHKEYMKLHKARVEAEGKKDRSKKIAELAKAKAKKAKKAIGRAQEAADSWANSVKEPVSV